MSCKCNKHFDPDGPSWWVLPALFSGIIVGGFMWFIANCLGLHHPVLFAFFSFICGGAVQIIGGPSYY